MNDIKKLYDASTSKDELAEVAEKLGIEDKSLAGILKELAGGMINVPVITADESEISVERYIQLRNSALIKYNGSFYCLCTATGVVDDALKMYEASRGELFVRSFVIDSGAVDYLEGILIYGKDDGYYVQGYDI